jgi:hypothetical protein
MSTTVTLPRARAEKVGAVLAVLLAAQVAFIGVQTTIHSPRFELSCQRATDDCSLSGADIFGGRWTSHVKLSTLRTSRVAPAGNGEVKWEVAIDQGQPFEIGYPTARASQVTGYRAYSAELQRFLDDPGQATFSVAFEGLGGPSGVFFVVFGAYLLIYAAFMLRGWSVAIEVDPATREVAVRPSPALLGGGSRSLPGAARARLRPGWTAFLILPWRAIVLEIVDGGGNVLYARRRMASPKHVGELSAAVVELHRALGASGRP